MQVVLILLPIALLVLAQGGFFGLAPCVCGVILSVIAGILWLRKPRRGANFLLVPLLWCGLALTYVVSAIASGASLTTLSESGAWAACAAFSLVAATQSPEAREQSLGALAWLGVVTAVAGVLVVAGLLPMAGGTADGMAGGRLQFSFQYANAAGAWYGASTLLCLLSPNNRHRAFAALPAAALLLTQSGGALLVFVAVAVVLGVRWARAGAWERLAAALVQAMLAIALFGFSQAFGTVGALVSLVAVFVACLCMHRGTHLHEGTVPSFMANPRKASVVLAALVGVAVLAGLVLMGTRVAEAMASLHERTYHVRDGLALWATSPLLGVGPDNWQYLYQYVQTAPYYTTVVHSSVVQAMLDAGIVGLVALVAACFFGMRALVHNARQSQGQGRAQDQGQGSGGGWAQAQLWVATFLLAHSFIEFDLQFASLAFLLAFLLSGPEGPAIRLKGLVVGVACMLVLLPASLLGTMCAASATALATANVRGDYATCEQLFSSNLFARADVAAQSEYVNALYLQGAYDRTVEAFQRMAAPTDRDATYAAISCYQKAKPVEATTILVERLEAQPYNTEFCSTATQLTSTFGLDPSLEARFYNAVDRVSQNAARFEGAD